MDILVMGLSRRKNVCLVCHKNVQWEILSSFEVKMRILIVVCATSKHCLNRPVFEVFADIFTIRSVFVVDYN